MVHGGPKKGGGSVNITTPGPRSLGNFYDKANLEEDYRPTSSLRTVDSSIYSIPGGVVTYWKPGRMHESYSTHACEYGLNASRTHIGL